MAITPEKRKAMEAFVSRYKANPEEGKKLVVATKKLRDLESKFKPKDSSASNISISARQQLSQAYEKVGDLYYQMGMGDLALKNYHGARDNTPYPNVRNRIGHRISELEERDSQYLGGLFQQRVLAMLAVISLGGALLSISLKLTGSVVGSSSTQSNWISLGLFFVGCLFTVFYFRTRKK